MANIKSTGSGRTIPAFFLIFLSLILAAGGCSSGSQDFIHLYVFNGYAGGGGVTVYGPEGQIVDNVLFAETSSIVTVDRGFYDGTLSILMDGVPGLVDIPVDLFALYPEETATLFVSRRSGFDQIETVLLRHHQLTAGGSSSCAVQFVNSLSLSNEYTDDRFDFQTEWNFTQAEYTTPVMYEATNGDGTLPGNIQIPVQCRDNFTLNDLQSEDTNAAQQVRGVREAQLARIKAEPWFFLTELPEDVSEQIGDGETVLAWRWGRWSAAAGDSISAIPGQIEFWECVGESVSFEAPDGDSNEDENECPPNAEVTVDYEALRQCYFSNNYTGITFSPGSTDLRTVITYNPSLYNGTTCNRNIRFRTRSVESIFDPPQKSGKFVVTKMDFPTGTWQYILLYGRPLAPFVHHITGGELGENFAEVEYPDGLLPLINKVREEQPLN